MEFHPQGAFLRSQLPVCTVTSSHPIPALGWPIALFYQKSLRKAVLGRPQALHGALFWVSPLMLCCKCILFKGCTNYKSVLGDEGKNIFSWLVSVNNLWCYLETWHSFCVTGNTHTVSEWLQHRHGAELSPGPAYEQSKKGIFWVTERTESMLMRCSTVQYRETLFSSELEEEEVFIPSVSHLFFLKKQQQGSTLGVPLCSCCMDFGKMSLVHYRTNRLCWMTCALNYTTYETGQI